MKKIICPLLTGLTMLCLAPAGVDAQEFKEHIDKEFAAPNPASEVLAIYNLNGPIRVEGYSGNKIVVGIDKTISSDDKEGLDLGKHEFQLGYDQHGDSVIIYIAEPFDTRPHEWRRDEGSSRREHNYDFNLAFVVRVPFGMNLHISTVNRGEEMIQDVTGNLSIHNVNGAITIKNAKGATKAHTINGNLTVNYVTAPQAASEYYTLNGTLEVTYPANLSAVCQFKSWSGSFFTDFPDAEALPAVITKNEEHRASGTTYKLNIAKRVQIGAGGSVFKFETMNGNIYVKKQS
ncbi:hypothetical protein [Puia sp.]|jgi:hypothetical protein|uniref:hypothetical protein n=1 Tax=Puia sp. TaxID=2045100 RepID=UPI002F426AF4